MRNYENEFKARVKFIKELLAACGASGIIYGNSGGKDCALVGILCKAACDDTKGVIMPCGSKRNYEMDTTDALTVAGAFEIETITVDLAPVQLAVIDALGSPELNSISKNNIAPRLRMTTLYAIAANENRLVAGTGNRSEIHMGYFTKWGDGAHDFNPISDLTVTEIYDFLRYLKAPQIIIDKAPSGGLFDGQTDESEMGIAYADIDNYLLNGEVNPENKKIIDNFYGKSMHKRSLPTTYIDFAER